MNNDAFNNTLNKAPDIIDWALQNTDNSVELLLFILFLSLIMIMLAAFSVLIYKWINYEKVKSLKLKEKELSSYSKQIPILFDYINKILDLFNLELDSIKQAFDKTLESLNGINSKLNNNMSKYDFISVLKFLLGKDSGFLTLCIKEMFDKFDNIKEMLLNDNSKLDESSYNELITNCEEIIRNEWSKVNQMIIDLNIDKTLKAEITNTITNSKVELDKVNVSIRKYLKDNYVFDTNNKLKFKQFAKNQLSKFTNDVYLIITDDLNRILED